MSGEWDRQGRADRMSSAHIWGFPENPFPQCSLLCLGHGPGVRPQPFPLAWLPGDTTCAQRGLLPRLGLGSTEPTALASLGARLERDGAASEYQVLRNQEQAFVPRVGQEHGDRAGRLRQGCPSCPIASGPGTGMPWEEGPPGRAPATWVCCWSHWAARRWRLDPGWGSQPVICSVPTPSLWAPWWQG